LWDGALPTETRITVFIGIRVIAKILGLAGKIKMGLKLEVERITYLKC
jgi:hypothetical protein